MSNQLEVTVKIVNIFPVQKFNSSKGEFVKHSFLGETQEQYSKKILFTVMGDERYAKLGGLVVGGVYSISFNVDSHEWNGKYFTDIIPWRAVPFGSNAQQPQPQVQQQAHAPQPSANNNTDVPPF